ncbi:acyl-CoA-binding domain protein [Perilla frutescens var. frutescens]|nr:acyl-CoA-binding domain protein [Perilla frutescens var. frutescens]
MGRTNRRQIFIALGLLMLMGIALHFRLWAIDHRASSNDSDLLRKQFDLANREAMDESAEWRRRFDSEFDKAAKCSRELEEIKKSTGGKTEASAVVNRRMEMMQKENVDLLERVESLKQELEAEKLKCSMHNM